MRGGALEPRLSLVLPARPGWRGARSLDLLEEPAREVPRQRPLAQAVRDDGRALHGRGSGPRVWAEGLVGAEGFAVDASLIRADVHRQRSVPGEEGLPPEAAGRAVTKYLDVLDDAAFGGATPVEPKRINLTDPAARWTAATREAAFYSYSTNYLINLDHAVIVDVAATTSVRQAEVLVRAPPTHTEAGPLAPARSRRSRRRVPPRRRSPEPPQTGQGAPHVEPRVGLRGTAIPLARNPHRILITAALEFFNRIGV